jgi:hypothetical protein
MMNQKDKVVGKQIKDCDVLFMIPGRMDKDVKQLPSAGNEDGRIFIEAIEDSMDEELQEGSRKKSLVNPSDEYKSRFTVLEEADENETKEKKFLWIKKKKEVKKRRVTVKTFDRSCLGSCELRFLPGPERPRGTETVSFPAFILLDRHTYSRFCVLELYVKDCDDGVHILEAFRHGRMRIEFEGKEYTESEFMASPKVRMTPWGSKRSAVFAYNEVNEQECINCLANEESPKDGRVAGFMKEIVEKNDRSQYEGIRTYASTATLLEICSFKPPTFKERLEYQTTEIFFIEMLLMRDASTSNIEHKLFRISDDIRDKKLRAKEAKAKLEAIHEDLSQAIQFSGTEHYCWPTVQRSVELLSLDFGLEDIEKKYDETENVLEDMIDAIQRKEQKTSEKIKNSFLIILTAMSTFSTVEGSLDKILEVDSTYIAAIISVAAMYIVYRLIDKFSEK